MVICLVNMILKNIKINFVKLKQNKILRVQYNVRLKGFKVDVMVNKIAGAFTKIEIVIIFFNFILYYFIYILVYIILF